MKRKYNQGFSLVELLIAMAILALIMVAIASFMSSTTNVYVNTKSDVELQQAGQETFDMIADKVMQATAVRVGTESAEYAALCDMSSVDVDATNLLLDAAGGTMEAVSIASETGSAASHRYVYAYEALTDGTITASNNLVYIAALYDSPMEVSEAGSTYSAYGYVVDIYYFWKNELFLFRYTPDYFTGSSVDSDKLIRSNSYNDGTSATEDYTKEELDDILTTCISQAASQILSASASDAALETLENNNLVCETIAFDETTGERGADLYAISSENAFYLTLNFEKKRETNSSEGMITIRNSYVLQPKKYEDIISGSGSIKASGSTVVA